MSTNCIETHNLSKHFGHKKAVNKLELAIPSGGIHAIVGSNGAGKSTLFRMLLGVETPTSGSAFVLGENCMDLSASTRARIAYVNEEHTLPMWMKVKDLLHMQKYFYPNWNEQVYRSVVGYFDVDISQKVSGLSRGERAGLNLAMVMAQQCEVLILDEPTLGLDVVAKQSFLEAILFSEFELNSTIIYCSHQMEEIERVAENLIVLEKGRLENNSPPEDFVNRISNYIVHFDGVKPDSSQFSGLLKLKHIDGLYHMTFLDQNDDVIHAKLKQQGASQVTRKATSLNEAVNAFLTRRHAVPASKPHAKSV